MLSQSAPMASDAFWPRSKNANRLQRIASEKLETNPSMPCMCASTRYQVHIRRLGSQWKSANDASSRIPVLTGMNSSARALFTVEKFKLVK